MWISGCAPRATAGRSVFAPQAMKLVAKSSEGLTRRINILADKSLLAAFANGTHQVTAKHARAAVRDSEFGARPVSVPNAWWFVGAGLVAGLLVGVSLHFANQLRLSHGAAPVADPMTAAPAPSPQAGGIANQAWPVQAALPSSERPELSQTPPRTAAPAFPAAPPCRHPDIAVPAGGRRFAATGSPAGRANGRPCSGKLAQERFASTQKWLKGAPNASWTIQVMTVGDAQLIERFLEEAAQRSSLTTSTSTA